MRIYTRSGDKGTTSLVYGQRVPKDHPRVQAYGTCDEANAMIGLAVSYLHYSEDWGGKEEFIATIERIQTILFHVGAELSTPPDKEVAWKLKEEHLLELEKQIDVWEEELPALRNFIIPSGLPAATALQSARTIVRRAERMVVALKDELQTPLVLTYLNRLSDFLFVAGRFVNTKGGGKEMHLQTDL